jgi:glucans biosynthesis protein C
MNKIYKGQIFLWAGIVAWVIFLLNLFVLAAVTPDYSHITNMISDLGRIEAPYHKIFNATFILYGLLYLPTGLGFFYSVKWFTGRNQLAITIGFLVAMFSISPIFAGLYPLPDPRHSGYGIGDIVQLILPFFLALAFWKTQGARSFAFFHLMSFIIFIIISFILIAIRLIGHGNIPNMGGFIQRISILIVFIWYIFTYYWLLTSKLKVL